MKKIFIMLFVAIMLLTVACSSRTVSRINNEEEIIDLSGRWNDSDESKVANELIKKFQNEWLRSFSMNHSKKPVVVVGKIRNKTTEHINTDGFIGQIETALINTGSVVFAADKRDREEILDEVDYQQDYTTEESMKEIGQQTASDYQFNGEILSTEDRWDGKKVIKYQIKLTLIDLEAGVRVWEGRTYVRKNINQSSVGW